MLHYEENGDLFALAAQKNHVSLYVMATQALEDKVKSLRAIDHGKGCLRFKKRSDIPDEAIKKLLIHAQ